MGMDTAQLASNLDESRSLDGLREVVRVLGQRIDMINGQGRCLVASNADTVYLTVSEHSLVNSILARGLLPTLPSTVTLLSSWMKGVPVDTLECLVSRVLRYVSSYPWGSNRAQANGSKSVYVNTMAKLTEVDLPRRTFAYGAAAMFIPGAVVHDGTFRQSEPLKVNRRAWRAQKAPPYSRNKVYTDKISDSLVVNLTPRILGWRKGEPYPMVLYDNRFLVKFDMSQVPKTVLALLERTPDAQICIAPHGPEQRPRISLHVDSHEEVLIDYRHDVLRMPEIKVPKHKIKSQAHRQRWVHMSLARTIQDI